MTESEVIGAGTEGGAEEEWLWLWLRLRLRGGEISPLWEKREINYFIMGLGPFFRFTVYSFVFFFFFLDLFFIFFLRFVFAFFLNELFSKFHFKLYILRMFSNSTF